MRPQIWREGEGEEERKAPPGRPRGEREAKREEVFDVGPPRAIETKREMKERLTARWAMGRFIGGASAAVLDPHLARTLAVERTLEMVLELAFRCMAPVRQDRPAMSDCCRALWAIRKTYRDMLAADATP